MGWEDLIAALTADSQTAVVVTDGGLAPPGPVIVYANAAFERMTGYSSAELLGRSPRLLQAREPASPPAACRRARCARGNAKGSP